MKYLSKEYCEALKERAATDEAYLKKTRGLTLKMQNLVTDCPGGVDKLLTWEFERGKILSYEFEEKPAPSDWRTTPMDGTKYLFRTVAPYDIYSALHKKEFSATEAMMKGFRVDGDMMKVLGKMAEFTIHLDFQSTIAVEY